MNKSQKSKVKSQKSKVKSQKHILKMKNKMTKIQNSKRSDEKIIRIQKTTRSAWNWSTKAHNFLRMKFKWYYKWHANPVSSHIHWSIMLLLLAGLLIVILIIFLGFGIMKYIFWMDSVLN
ncbi:MAG: hypothetical protein CEN89_1 [Candidatus Berkelbacteria bacterium Licking1014_7]|uniref:Uncharacterized protein n=1 Tax=Candidatus Berkelbacteria bacterium Licking1014_7 TaxID=2017147 RepID=A0A554LKW6_9BACT|nr:MAG: hypothetical protein CEN89_1 [Candidatus Berkelbacteria bacterium Licking1014_7]